MALFDLLTTTVSKLQELLSSNKLSSVQLITAYLNQIEKHNHVGLKLHAMISIAPEKALLEQASKLDQERDAGCLRGPLHGIPLVVKVRPSSLSLLNSNEFTGSCRIIFALALLEWTPHVAALPSKALRHLTMRSLLMH